LPTYNPGVISFFINWWGLICGFEGVEHPLAEKRFDNKAFIDRLFLGDITLVCGR
jgi:hypothetical protein